MPMIFRLKFTSQIDFVSGNMAVDIHTTRHDYHAMSINTSAIGGNPLNNLAILNTNILYFSINIIDRIVNLAIFYANCGTHVFPFINRLSCCFIIIGNSAKLTDSMFDST